MPTEFDLDKFMEELEKTRQDYISKSATANNYPLSKRYAELANLLTSCNNIIINYLETGKADVP